MPITSFDVTTGPYSGNGTKATYDYDFPIEAKTELQVYFTATSGTVTLLDVDTNYTVAGVGDEDGGTITLLAGNLATGESLFIRSNRAQTQQTDFESIGSFLPDEHTKVADKLTVLVQQLFDRAIKWPGKFLRSETQSELPESAGSQLIGYNSTGDQLQVYPLGSEPATLGTLMYTPAGTGAVNRTVESVLRQWVSVKDFGAVGDGATDDSAAINLAIATAMWAYDTNTVTTERNAIAVTVYFPKGVYRMTEKLRLAPGLALVGETGGTHSRTTSNTDPTKQGTAILFDYAGATDYAVDTSNFAGAAHPTATEGDRVDNWAASGGDQAGGIVSFCSGWRMENLNLICDSTQDLRGINATGCPMHTLRNVSVYGFIVGIRCAAAWGANWDNVRIESARWRGVVFGDDVNAGSFVFYTSKGGTAYTPSGGSTIGDSEWTEYEGSPALFGGTVRADLELSHGVWIKDSRPGISNGTIIEGFARGIGLRGSNAVIVCEMEGINDRLIADYAGAGFGSKIYLTAVRACTTASVFSGVDSHTEVHLPKTIDLDTAIGGKNIAAWTSPTFQTVPVITGRDSDATETLANFSYHAFNDGILVSPSREADLTNGGTQVYTPSNTVFDVNLRTQTDIVVSYRGANKFSVQGVDGNPKMFLGSDSGSTYFSVDTDGNITDIDTVNASMSFSMSGTEAARFDSSRNWLVGQSTVSSSTVGTSLRANGASVSTVDGGTVSFLNRLTSDGKIETFSRSSSEVGDISVTTVATTFNSTSDWRKKRDQVSIEDSGERIDALKPYIYTWKETGEKARGFFAHEFAEVYPNVVRGKKDAVDENNKPVYQSMQASAPDVMADLVAEIQSLRKRVKQLENGSA